MLFKMQFRHFVQLRHLSTSRTLLRPALSADYKSKKSWDERLNCPMLSDINLLKSINTKIMSEFKLNNLEVDIFINVAAPRTNEIDQLQEVVRTLKQFRRTLTCHTMLPSTAHATCRLFIDSEKTSSLISLLEARVDHGVFPDFFCLNLLFDELLEREEHALASRAAALIMLQEEFGLNKLTDYLALYSVARYVESKTDFSDWSKQDITTDPIFLNQDEQQTKAAKEEEEKKDEADDDEEEDDAEYIRVPWLRNPYFDNHFDLVNPRAICGKTLSMVSLMLQQSNEPELAIKCQLLGTILQGNWSGAKEASRMCNSSKTKAGPMKELCRFYIENLHDINPPSEDMRAVLLADIDNLSNEGEHISDQSEQRFNSLKSLEEQDINQFKSSVEEWSRLRHSTKKAKEDYEARLKLIAEIKAKKEELKSKEELLYFYDDLKKRSLTRIEYD